MTPAEAVIFHARIAAAIEGLGLRPPQGRSPRSGQGFALPLGLTEARTMSYWISLEDRSGDTPRICEVPTHTEGATFNVLGETQASLNVTYNYTECFRLVPGFEGIAKTLGEKRAGDTIDWLQAAVDLLQDRPYADYWAPTPGNAGHAAAILLGWARQYPDAVWSVS